MYAGDALAASCDEECVRDLPGPDGGYMQRAECGGMIEELFGEGGDFVFAAPGHADRDVEDHGIHQKR